MLTALLFAAAPVLDNVTGWYHELNPFVAADPAESAFYAYEDGGLVTDADFYVSPDGNDDDPGSLDRPFRTPERARDAVRALNKSGRSGVTVAFRAGEYYVKALNFGAEDGGTADCPITWCAYGNKILYNCIYELGSGDFTPCGIYMDDALSGQTIVGNLLVNIPGYALHLGGGRDLDVHNNIIVSGGQRGISYDQRAIDGFYGGWFSEHSGPNGNMWTELRNSPWKTETWLEAFPQMAQLSDDMSDPDAPGFAANPAGSTVYDNLFVTGKHTVGEIGEKVFRYSTFYGNGLFGKTQLKSLFTDPDRGDYSLREGSPMLTFAPAFRDLPLAQMGRQSDPVSAEN